MTSALSGPLIETGFLSGAKGSVLIALANFADEHDESWVSYEAIRVSARCSRRAAISGVDWLERHGLIHVNRAKGGKAKRQKEATRSNVYTLNTSFLLALETLCRRARRHGGRDPARKWEAVSEVAEWAQARVEAGRWEDVCDLAMGGDRAPHDLPPLDAALAAPGEDDDAGDRDGELSSPSGADGELSSPSMGGEGELSSPLRVQTGAAEGEPSSPYPPVEPPKDSSSNGCARARWRPMAASRARPP